MNKPAQAWQDWENEIIVRDYLKMLKLELTGRRFNKTERRDALLNQLDRSEKAIEMKIRNISAVMERLGIRFIKGYSPLAHYQKKLFKVVEKQLTDNKILDLSTLPGNAKAPVDGIEFVKPPTINKNPKKIDPEIQQILRKFDPAARDAQARKLGEAGESYCYNAEKSRLSYIGRGDLAERVRWVSKEDGDGAGYDILSFTNQGEARWLEVKTTNGSERTPFWITRNELCVSNENPDYFRLVRIFNFSREPGAYKLRPPLKDFVNLKATQYHASF